MSNHKRFWPSARRSIAPERAPLSDSTASKVLLPFIVERQPRDSKWCWAAVTASISQFLGRIRLSQCDVAGVVLGKTCCQQPLPPPACDAYWGLGDVLTKTGHLAGPPVRGPARAIVIRNALRAGKPVCMRVRWSDRTGHFLVIVGMTDGSRDPTLHVSDPAYGEFDWPLSALSQRYRGTGVWTHSYETKAS